MLVQRPRFWQEINRLGAQNGDILTDGTHRWQYSVQRCGCQAKLEQIFGGGRPPEPIYLSAKVPGDELRLEVNPSNT